MQDLRDRLRAAEADRDSSKAQNKALGQRLQEEKDEREKERNRREDEVVELHGKADSLEAELASCRAEVAALEEEKRALQDRFNNLDEIHGKIAGVPLSSIVQYIKNKCNATERHARTHALCFRSVFAFGCAGSSKHEQCCAGPPLLPKLWQRKPT